MFHLLLFIVVFLVVYFVFKLIFDDALRRDKKNIKEIGVAKKVFHLDEKKIDNKKLLNGVSIINAFIVAITFIVVDLIGLDKAYWLAIAFVIIIALIFICYSIYGKILYKKWGKDEDDEEL